MSLNTVATKTLIELQKTHATEPVIRNLSSGRLCSPRHWFDEAIRSAAIEDFHWARPPLHICVEAGNGRRRDSRDLTTITGLAASTDENGNATVELSRGDRWTLAAIMRDETTGAVMCSTVERAGPDVFPASIQFAIDQPSCRLMQNSLQIDLMTNAGPGEYRTITIRVSRTDGRAMVPTTVGVTSEERLSLVQLEAGEDGRLDVPLPVGRVVLLAARDASCSSVPILVDASGPTVRWRRLGPDENLSTWRAAGPFDRTGGPELVFERVPPGCR